MMNLTVNHRENGWFRAPKGKRGARMSSTKNSFIECDTSGGYAHATLMANTGIRRNGLEPIVPGDSHQQRRVYRLT